MTLTNRYMAAALSSLPADKHQDIGRELRGSIADAVDARIAAGESPVDAEAAVLTDLGDPDRLAAGLAGRPMYLIGPEFFLDWWRLLKALVWIAPLVGAILLVVDLIEGSTGVEALVTGLSITVEVALQIVFWVTVVFAVLERNGTRRKDLAGEWTVDRLPHSTTNGRVSLGDTVFSVGMLVFLIVVFIAQRTSSTFEDSEGAPIPFIAPDLWNFWMPVLLVVLALEAVFEIVKYTVRRRTMLLAGVDTVLNLLVAIPLVWLLSNDRFFNPAFFDAAFPGVTFAVGPAQTTLFPQMTLFSQGILVLVVVVTAWTIGETWFKALRPLSRSSAGVSL
ncbi:permease prefix domain 1-containing protein [Rhodococcus sp. (in: high G+C Gram-positive bacteria)]|uniref:permease prefix domain 1-containing protein n=1 Tax=Rhodococcus sp. TaxID=1831 RepID=UPI00388D06B6